MQQIPTEHHICSTAQVQHPQWGGRYSTFCSADFACLNSPSITSTASCSRWQCTAHIKPNKHYSIQFCNAQKDTDFPSETQAMASTIQLRLHSLYVQLHATWSQSEVGGWLVTSALLRMYTVPQARGIPWHNQGRKMPTRDLSMSPKCAPCPLTVRTVGDTQDRIAPTTIQIQWNLSIQDILNKGHLSNEDTVCSPKHIELCTILPLK